MKMYGGNSKRVIKKLSSFCFDGVYYNWPTAMKLMELISRLKVGHLVWIPYTSEWGTLERLSFSRRELYHFWRSRKVKGWHLDEPIMEVRSNSGNLYYVYDIEHWNPWCCEKVKKEDAVRFNRQIGLPDDYRLKEWFELYAYLE